MKIDRNRDADKDYEAKQEYVEGADKDYDEAYPEARNTQREKGRYTPYKAGGAKRSKK